ncbi:U7 snRNA-associated Sm-like protein LSm10 [Nematostella vectensis]|uniref:U7 snRNA-associated Sm-like protein LSm10 n=1 Tax=Nematostella vectensis TaxID=45351 RepID=UPI0020773FA1|nr:U7 snRNA-associated Sm-like protein LSm10 [Nematostella vectensis]
MAGRERAIAERSLVCLIKAVQGYNTTVELRNESYLEGFIEHVDGFMNIKMKDVKFVKASGEVDNLPAMFIVGTQIRYVHIPDEIDMRKAIEQELGKIQGTRTVKRERKMKKRKI